MKKRAGLSLLLALTLALSGCAQWEDSQSNGQTQSAQEHAAVETADTELAGDDSEMFTDRDMKTDYDISAVAVITLRGDTASCDSEGVEIDGSTVTITEEGTYILSGTLEDGMILVDASDSDKVQLVLDGAEITNSTSAALYVREADKVFVTTALGSRNTLANGGEYLQVDDNNIDAALFSKSDLTLNGAGTLTITAAQGHGVVSKDDLVLTSGTYIITAADHGLSGKDSVRIAGGSYQITAGKDGIHGENADDPDLGYLYIAGGTFDIQAAGDGISAAAYLQIQDGSFTLYTGQGSASVTMTDDRGEENSVSTKGLKSDGPITIAGGSFVTDTEDDSIHAGGNIVITGGQFQIETGDDGIHSDGAVTIQDGSFILSYCYEGIEGLSVTIHGGTFAITSQDDGINAAGGADSSGFGGGRPGQDQFSADSESFITIEGGTITIVSGGDSIDSNGDLTINGGTLDLTCNGSNDTALDCDGSYTNNGGHVTTNDGSESDPGRMGGGSRDPGMNRERKQP